MTDMSSQTIHLRPGDETILKYHGAAVVLQWNDLPEPVQASLLRQASAVGGLPVAGNLQDSIKALLERDSHWQILLTCCAAAGRRPRDASACRSSPSAIVTASAPPDLSRRRKIALSA